MEERATDRDGNKYMTIKELQEQEARRRAGLQSHPFPIILIWVRKLKGLTEMHCLLKANFVGALSSAPTQNTRCE